MNRETALKQNLDLQREILARLRRGMSISEACRDLGISRDGKFRYLRRKFKDFDAAVKEIRWGHNQSPDDPNAVGTSAREWGTEFDDARIESFLVTYRETQSRDQSARAAGFLPTTVEQMLDPTSKKFHSEFARAMREEEKRALWEIEDDLLRQARAGDAVTQRFVLERRLSEYGTRAKSATESNDNKFTQEVLLKTMENMSALMSEIRKQAGVAQLEERRFRNATVAGSIPVAGSIDPDETPN